MGQEGEYNIVNQAFEKELKTNQDAEETSRLREGAAESAAPTMGEDAIPDKEDLGIVMGTDADVTEEDIALLGDKDQDMDDGEDEMYSNAGLDDTDLDGDPLNEAETDMASTGDDLDMPGDGVDDPKKKSMEEGDEENDYYSLGSDNNDDVTEGTP
jgi:hypothetical protein